MSQDRGPRQNVPDSLHSLLLRLDQATEVLEGMDDLNVQTRQELEALMAELELQIADAEPES